MVELLAGACRRAGWTVRDSEAPIAPTPNGAADAIDAARTTTHRATARTPSLSPIRPTTRRGARSRGHAPAADCKARSADATARAIGARSCSRRITSTTLLHVMPPGCSYMLHSMARLLHS
jgi:hypothetical protein